jgi:hypothetical protein
MENKEPLGSWTCEERVALITICQDGGNTALTKSYESESLAALKSIVSINPVLEPN